MSLFWLSFVDPNAEEGDKFCGACIVVADSFKKALTETILQGCNAGPHTEVLTQRVHKEDEQQLLSVFEINKLYSPKELDDKGWFTDYEHQTQH
jgi:hypothetical protein